jgi:hypothetical protein
MTRTAINPEIRIALASSLLAVRLADPSQTIVPRPDPVLLLRDVTVIAFTIREKAKLLDSPADTDVLKKSVSFFVNRQ